ncbi:MAG: hypothetical protein ACHP7E_12840 [Burkholderiales bacterium]
MQKVIVYLDDPGYARQRLAGAGAARTHWELVACAPRMTQRSSKWVSHSARENWRSRWAAKLFEQVVPFLEGRGDEVTPVLARGPLPELTRSLMAEHRTESVLDARRPRQDGPGDRGHWAPGALMGLGALLFLACDF